MYIKILFSSVKYLLRKTRGLSCLTQCGYIYFFIDRAFSPTELSLCTAKYILHPKTESNIYLNISACILCDPEWILFYLWWTREDHQDGWLGQATTINSTSSANQTHDFELMCKNKSYGFAFIT